MELFQAGKERVQEKRRRKIRNIVMGYRFEDRLLDFVCALEIERNFNMQQPLF